MQKHIKITVIFAAFGFLLSFLFGLFSHSSILMILLKALIFAVVFAALGFCISFLFSKFLIDEAHENDSIPENSAAANNSRGQNVDIVIQDQEIERSDSPNSFDVGSSFQMLNSSDIASGSPIASSADSNQSSSGSDEMSKANQDAVEHNTIGEQFIPINNFQKVDKATVTGQSVNTSVADSPVINLNNNETGVVTDELDTLPDLGTIEVQKASDGSNSEEESMSEYSASESMDSGVSSISSRSSHSGDENIEIKDASLMAKAISSILSNEES